MLETSRNHDPMRDCRWTVTTTGANQTIVVGYASHGLRRSLFSEICLDYVKISHRDRAPIWVCGDDTKSVDVFPHSVNFTLHLNPTWTMESASALVVLYVTAASLPDSMGQCKNGSFFCAVSGICIWDGFICDGVANCLDYDDEHLFYGSTCRKR
ncbi:hypothetical protein V5799_032680 [Amblyomma americanum]|uniref:CUB domain-containing protein n=1 Tax=Amblyomma americanum TaxID=6943 RepID=A0AAQ4DQF9_AMBAM